VYQYDVRNTQAELVIESFTSTTAVVSGRYTITEPGAGGPTTLSGAFTGGALCGRPEGSRLSVVASRTRRAPRSCDRAT
jgi:hypothetical protein